MTSFSDVQEKEKNLNQFQLVSIYTIKLLLPSYNENSLKLICILTEILKKRVTVAFFIVNKEPRFTLHTTNFTFKLAKSSKTKN